MVSFPVTCNYFFWSFWYSAYWLPQAYSNSFNKYCTISNDIFSFVNQPPVSFFVVNSLTCSCLLSSQTVSFATTFLDVCGTAASLCSLLVTCSVQPIHFLLVYSFLLILIQGLSTFWSILISLFWYCNICTVKSDSEMSVLCSSNILNLLSAIVIHVIDISKI